MSAEKKDFINWNDHCLVVYCLCGNPEQIWVGEKEETQCPVCDRLYRWDVLVNVRVTTIGGIV